MGTLNIVFLDIWLPHKARYKLTQARSGLRLLPRFLGAFSQGQIPTDTSEVWSETFASVPWSFLTRPDANSHRQGPTADSNTSPFYFLNVEIPAWPWLQKFCKILIVIGDRSILYKKLYRGEIPRWQLEGGNRKQASYSEILERCWRHTLQA
jgi:hypothetical protein